MPDTSYASMMRQLAATSAAKPAAAPGGVARPAEGAAQTRGAIQSQLLQPGSGVTYNAGSNSYTGAQGQNLIMDPNGRVMPSSYTKTGPDTYYDTAPSRDYGMTPETLALQGLQKAVSGIGGSFGGGMVSAPSVGAISDIPRVSMRAIPGGPDTNAAQDAAFGKAKATAGSLGRSAMDSLRAGLAERGLVGGGTEARGLVSKLAEATNPLSDLNNAALHENVGIAEHNQDLGAQAAATDYSGNVSQRNTDVNAAVAQRGQEIQAQQAAAARNQQALQGLISSFSKILY
jgi:hypothetical protein